MSEITRNHHRLCVRVCCLSRINPNSVSLLLLLLFVDDQYSQAAVIKPDKDCSRRTGRKERERSNVNGDKAYLEVLLALS